jgi:hypothetical protein
MTSSVIGLLLPLWCVGSPKGGPIFVEHARIAIAT